MNIKLAVATDLYKVLVKEYPAPWQVTYHAQMPHHPKAFVAEVQSASGQVIMSKETFSGDGDMINLSDKSLVALVDFVNAFSAASVAGS